MNRRHFLKIITGTLVAGTSVIAGCSHKPTKYFVNPYVAKSLNPPEIKHCFTTIGHKPGTKPFIHGGTCCCTPTPELMEQYHADGFLLDMDVDDLIAEYEQRGIILEHDDGWQCNNMCDSGPHLVFGGKCMVPPTIGTQNYENVIVGKKPKV